MFRHLMGTLAARRLGSASQVRRTVGLGVADGNSVFLAGLRLSWLVGSLSGCWLSVGGTGDGAELGMAGRAGS